MATPHSGAAAGDPTRRLMWLLAPTAFIVSGSIHYQTPALVAIATEMGADAAATGWIPTLSFGGMLLGIMLLVPLGDRIDKRRLILAKLVMLLCAQMAMYFAPSIAVLAVASLVTGMGTSLLQLALAIIAETARPAERGRATGTLFTALFLGILSARIVGGLITTHFGWRTNYLLSVGLIATLLPVLFVHLPSSQPTTTLTYRELMWSLIALLRSHAIIRRIAAIQFLLGMCYGGFWAVLAPMLAALHRVGPTQAGLMGIPGAAGIFIARPAGRWMDRAGARPVVGVGIGLTLAAWLLFGLGTWTILAIIAGAMLLDCGIRAALVANQTYVSTLLPEARARSITVFATHVWGGNAVGAYIASSVFAHFGWHAVCALGVVFAGLALALHWRAAAVAGLART